MIQSIKWISTNDRLPEIGQEVLFVSKSVLTEDGYFAFGWRQSKTEWLIESEYNIYLGSHETEEGKNIVCWAEMIDYKHIIEVIQKNDKN